MHFPDAARTTFCGRIFNTSNLAAHLCFNFFASNPHWSGLVSPVATPLCLQDRPPHGRPHHVPLMARAGPLLAQHPLHHSHRHLVGPDHVQPHHHDHCQGHQVALESRVRPLRPTVAQERYLTPTGSGRTRPTGPALRHDRSRTCFSTEEDVDSGARTCLTADPVAGQ